MFDRTDYALADFLLFSERVYYRMFELHNAALWPAHILTMMVGACVVIAMLKPSKARVQIAFALLALTWLFVAWTFFIERYATINWAARYVAPAFVLQALLLGFMATRPTANDIVRPLGYSSILGLGVLLFSLMGYPLIAKVLGRPWGAAEMFGVAPDPTVTATLAFLTMARGIYVLLAAVIPLLWIAMTFLTLKTLGSPDMIVAPVAALVCALAYVARR